MLQWSLSPRVRVRITATRVQPPEVRPHKAVPRIGEAGPEDTLNLAA